MTRQMPEDVLSILEVVGLRPVMVEGLRCAGAMVPQHDLVLLRAGLDEWELEDVVGKVVSAAADTLSEGLDK